MPLGRAPLLDSCLPPFPPSLCRYVLHAMEKAHPALRLGHSVGRLKYL